MTTHVYSKVANATLNDTLTLSLASGETVLNATAGIASPIDASGITLTLGAAVNPIAITLVGGNAGTTYGFPVTVTTNLATYVVTVAVACLATSFDPYLNQSPTAYQQLVGSLGAGKSALATTIFNFATTFDPTGGQVTWDLLSQDGTVYASGNAYDYTVTSTGFANTVSAHCVISIPTNIPPALDAPYQLRYTLAVGNGVAYNYENIQVLGMPDAQLGTQDAVELQGDMATLSLVTESIYANYVLEIYDDTNLLASAPFSNPERIANGYYIGGTIPTTSLPVTLVPYKLVWKFWNNPNQVFRETANLWIVNPSIMNAVDDVKSKINKARQTLFGTPDSQYPSTEILKWLRRGMDAFNGAYGVFTSFTMTNAQGVVREFWLSYGEKYSLEAQYGLEAEKMFNFSGAAISLDVDRTGLIDNMIGKIQSYLDQEVKAVKQNLIIKGWTLGDGSAGGTANFGKLAGSGSMGAVGISITPALLYNAGFYNRVI